MNGNSRSLAERVEQVLPTLNLAVLLIPIVAMAMQLGSAAAGFVAATAPTDVAELETPVQARTRLGQPRAVEEPRPATELPHAGVPRPRDGRVAHPSLADPLLGYGI